MTRQYNSNINGQQSSSVAPLILSLFDSSHRTINFFFAILSASKYQRSRKITEISPVRVRHRESQRPERGVVPLIRAARPIAFREARAAKRTCAGCSRPVRNTRTPTSSVNINRWPGLPSTRWLRTPDANNPLPLMTGEKQCAGFNTGSETRPRSCVVGGHLSTERRTIAAATAAAKVAGAASVAFTVLRLLPPRAGFLDFMGMQYTPDKDTRTPRAVSSLAVNFLRRCCSVRGVGGNYCLLASRRRDG